MRYDREHLPEGQWREFRKLTVTKAIQMKQDFEVLTIDGNLACGKSGDYILVDSHGHPYPCAKHEFIAIYTPVQKVA
jgi:hypothetical protein